MMVAELGKLRPAILTLINIAHLLSSCQLPGERPLSGPLSLFCDFVLCAERQLLVAVRAGFVFFSS